jgi:transposase InsO family protein
MGAENPTWGEERIANELKLKLGIRVSPRTVEKYLRNGGPVRTPDPNQRWLTFVHNHAKAIAACDFFVVVTASFRTLYVLVMMELGTRRILHHNVTVHPTAEWTLQQFREALPGGHPYRFVIHDRDSNFSRELDKGVTAMGVRALPTPVRAPKANSVCERFGGTLRRECLDFFIPFHERHSRSIKMLSKQRPRPSMLTAIFLASSWPVNFSLVNCDPWSLLKISGRPRPSARSSASKQNSIPIVSDSDQLNTNRLNQSRIATRYTNPWAIRMYVISVLHTWLTRSILTPRNRYG